MEQVTMMDMALPEMTLVKDGYAYLYDTVQRSILFGDIFRKRGNTYLDHLKQDQPPVLAFDYDIISDGRNRERPVNFQLVTIIDRRKQKPVKKKSEISEKRGIEAYNHSTGHAPGKRPIVVIDPRAGHGPGLGGSKLDSQIGVALNAGHPVYFVMFLTTPVPGQTIADVQQCQIYFLEEVAKRHPAALKPAVIGNCQAGWAAALIAADRPDVTGPLVLNGSPLSYWGGVKGASPMRYRGGILGGIWLASLSSDLGNGRFDGAHLVAGFEEFNTANTFWTKLYTLYSKIDTEEKRFLDFEKWWGGFFLLSKEEIRFIAGNLFVSDEFEQGFLQLHEGSYINLKNLKDPIVIFASRGDNITPPQQALNWITKVYNSVEEIKECGQVIVYLLHDSIGHLGIFVSSKINRKEHTKIIGCVDAIEFLAPGLYEMIIRDGPSKPWLNDHRVDFTERSMEDILQMDNGLEDEYAFYSVSTVSKVNDALYHEYLSPWVQLFSTDFSAEFIKQTHPLRIQRYGFSDLNPFMAPFNGMAKIVSKNRRPAAEDNVFLKMEAVFSDMMINTLDFYQKARDDFFETMFYSLYGNKFNKILFCNDEKVNKPELFHAEQKKSPMFKALDNQLWLSAMKTGGFEEAVIRIILAVSSADHIFGMTEYDTAKSSMKTDKRLKKISPDQLKNMIKDQSAILEKNRDMALETLPDLIPEEQDRLTAVRIAGNIACADMGLKLKETALVKKIEAILLK